MLLTIRILIQPIGYVSPDEVNALTERLKGKFPFNTKIFPVIWPLQPPYSSYNIRRMQYDAEKINEFIAKKHIGFLGKKGSYVLGVAGFDGYYDGLRFVFGLASIDLKVATIYTPRLKEQKEKYYERLGKEGTHELGHLFGLSHCKNKYCVMSFSNSIAEVDDKGEDLCPECKAKLTRIFH